MAVGRAECRFSSGEWPEDAGSSTPPPLSGRLNECNRSPNGVWEAAAECVYETNHNAPAGARTGGLGFAPDSLVIAPLDSTV